MVSVFELVIAMIAFGSLVTTIILVADHRKK